jgi:membrane protein YqaA with SNARE-associated domain
VSKLTEFFAYLPTPALVGLAIVLVIQLALQVTGLIDLSRRARVPGGRKWVWVLVIILGNLVGAILYWAIGRSAPDAAADAGGGDAEARKRALDRLYGDRERR